jgi:ssDNA-binding Zn-finger/Zn-ribbon topoisomerase 1
MQKAKEQKDTTKEEQQKGSVSKQLSTKNKENAARDPTMEDKIDLERREAYTDPKTRDLLRKLLQGGDNEEILPIYTPGLGFVYQTEGLTPSESAIDLPRDLLENLAQLDIIKKSFYDSVSACPECESAIMTLHNRCPKCKSHNVAKTSLTEHIPCGHINQRDKYVNDQCPQCGQLLVEGQYRNMGRWYVCQKCGDKFDHPESDLICRSCNKNFTIKEAQVVEVPKFSLNLARKKEVRQNVASLETMRVLLLDLGFRVEIPGLAVGEKSGMQHHFSLMAKKLINGQEIIVALDHAISELEVQTSPLILYIYKISEIKVDLPMFMAMPQLNETAKKIAQGHNILVLEGSPDDEKIINEMRSEIQDRLLQKSTESQQQLTPQPVVPSEKTQTKSFLGKFSLKKNDKGS